MKAATSLMAAAWVTMAGGVAVADPIDLVKYDFTVVHGTTETGSGYNAVVVSGVTATPMADTSGQVTMVTGTLSYPGGNIVMNVDPDGVTSFASTVYFGFTVTPDAGKQIDLSSLRIDAARGGSGTPRGFAVRTSADGFAADLPIDPNSASIPTVRPTLTQFTVDLSGTAFNQLTNALEVRIYPFSPANGQSIDFDHIYLAGEVSSVPEPAAMGVLGLASLMIAGRGAHRSAR